MLAIVQNKTKLFKFYFLKDFSLIEHAHAQTNWSYRLNKWETKPENWLNMALIYFMQNRPILLLSLKNLDENVKSVG